VTRWTVISADIFYQAHDQDIRFQEFFQMNIIVRTIDDALNLFEYMLLDTMCYLQEAQRIESLRFQGQVENSDVVAKMNLLHVVEQHNHVGIYDVLGLTFYCKYIWGFLVDIYKAMHFEHVEL